MPLDERLQQELAAAAALYKGLREGSYDRDSPLYGLSSGDVPGVLALATLLRAQAAPRSENAPMLPATFDYTALTREIVAGLGTGKTEAPTFDYDRMAATVAHLLTAPSREDRVPYVKVWASWGYKNFRGDGTDALVATESVLGRLGALWTPQRELFVGGERREYALPLPLSDEEKERFLGGKLDMTAFLERRDEGLLLSVDPDAGDEGVDIALTAYAPDFVQGQHDLEEHFEPRARKVLVGVLQDIENELCEDPFEFTDDDIGVEGYADRYKTWEPSSDSDA